MAAKKPYTVVPAPLPTPHLAATPAGPRPTPVAPEQYTRSDLLHHGSTDYAKLRHRAEAINAAKLDARDGTSWYKQGLSSTELYYIWNSQYGRCGNAACQLPLDQRSMTIDHLVPKSMYVSGTWDIHNMTMLCHSCNSKKGVNYLPGIVQPTLVPDHIHKWATGGGAGGGDFGGKW